jgi:hypothetical protein
MRSSVLCLLALALGGATALSETLYAARKNTTIREGAGSYYLLVASVPENTPLIVLSRSGPWVKVQLPGKQVGWVASNCLTGERSTAVAARQGDLMWNSPRALSAAIKGFSGKYAQGEPGVVDTVLRYSVKEFSREDLARFTQEVRAFPSANRGRVSLEDLHLTLPAYDADLPEQQIGVTVAARISGKGMVGARHLRRYLNLVCAGIAETSPVYDADLTVLVLNERRINAFALPGGYIVVTLGLLTQCKDESELAGVIAHEVAHVVRRHGLQELSERSAQIRADAGFQELDEEVGEKSAEEEELESLLNQTYEKMVHPRLLSYELEADRIAAVLVANAGYDPFGLVRISERVARAARESPSIFDVDYMLPDDAAERSCQIRTFAEEHFVTESPGERMPERFARATSSLR